ncbi:hypothetical protein POM88_038512 [Heracleum sosnowskyi]|uniref:Uncharacterized protein n=1 Tax=Heracleum sosnowskyi TaxID=360622 RepID=A0AAD8HAI1_9APIA|nr:hypothetical protein POM88_038512 [Heracleum sosnowskyi]
MGCMLRRIIVTMAASAPQTFVSSSFPEILGDSFRNIGENDYNVVVASVIRREKFDEDSFLVLELPGKIIRYNLVDGSFKVIMEFDVPYSLRQWLCGSFKSWAYIE